MSEIAVRGTQEEQKLFTDVYQHFIMAREDLDKRIPDFDKKDILFRSHINKEDWPYRAVVFDPRIFTALYEKSARILANKPRGRMLPREGGDALGAQINNTLLDFQWEDNERVDNLPMLAKWQLLDLSARKYGAGFALCKWHYQRQKIDDKNVVFYDGPNFKPLNNRDCLMNPSYSTVKNWFQHRDYVTLQELTTTNDAARGKPIYKNLDILRQSLKENSRQGGDMRDVNYTIKNKSIKGLSDFLGRDEVYKTIEIITEYRDDRWITFSPKLGLILRDIPNPYKHGQIPIVQLKYYPIDDDGYGLSEIEPVEKLQNATNALICQYLDGINLSTYGIVKVRSTGGAVQMHTLEFGPGKKWLMNDPVSDVVPYEQTIAGVQTFPQTYRFLIGAMQEALGDTSVGVSNLNPGAGTKTATEIKDSAVSRSARDNFNLMFLGEAIKRQMMFWHKMNQQFLFSNPDEKQKVIRVVGKDAIKYFQNAGLDAEGLEDSDVDMITSPEMEGVNVDINDLKKPLYPVQVGDETVPKFNMEEGSQMGRLIVEPEDLAGNYDFIPDVESMRLPDEQQIVEAKRQMLDIALNPATQQLLAQEQYKLRAKELLEDYFEQLGTKDADKYFEKINPQDVQNQQLQAQNGQAQPGGEAGTEAGAALMGDVGNGGMENSLPSFPDGQAQPVVS